MTKLIIEVLELAIKGIYSNLYKEGWDGANDYMCTAIRRACGKKNLLIADKILSYLQDIPHKAVVMDRWEYCQINGQTLRLLNYNPDGTVIKNEYHYIMRAFVLTEWKKSWEYKLEQELL